LASDLQTTFIVEASLKNKIPGETFGLKVVTIANCALQEWSYRRSSAGLLDRVC